MNDHLIYEAGNEAFRDRMSNTKEDGHRDWFYVSKVKGKYTKYRELLNYAYFAVFFSLPFIYFNGKPFFMINFPKGEFIVFGNIFWPQDFFIFAIGMITLIIFIVLFTAIYGRLFCGWVCPQTVFMEGLFRRIEWWIEGSASQQKKLDQSGWNGEKIRKRGLKHLVFIILSFCIANTFLAYIISVEELYKIIREPLADHLTLLSGIVIFTGVFYGVFAYVREIVCTTICPYGRLQSVMLDKNSMQVAYDYNRGEPRGRMSKLDPAPKGDCIDCKKCVIVCPTGIDIRNGVQMECVGCTACIDACDEVMEKIHLPLGLIRYASENQIANKTSFVFTTRMKVYSGVLVLLFGVMSFLIMSSSNVEGQISRVKGQLYQELPDGKISNLFDGKFINKTHKDQELELKINGLAGEVKMITTHKPVLKKEALSEFTFFIILNEKDIIKRSTKLSIDVMANGEKVQTINTTFLGQFR